MIVIKVTFADGDSCVTRFNGTFKEAEEHYLGKRFLLRGLDERNTTTAVAVERIYGYEPA